MNRAPAGKRWDARRQMYVPNVVVGTPKHSHELHLLEIEWAEEDMAAEIEELRRKAGAA